MPCPDEVNPSIWQHFAAWQTKWEGKSNHVSTYVLSEQRGGRVMRMVPVTLVFPLCLFVCHYSRLRHLHKATTHCIAHSYSGDKKV